MNGIGNLPWIDPSKPNVARAYDYYLGGTNNFEADRMAVARIDEIVPGTRGLAINNRRCLTRVVRTLAADYGVRQFIDLGSGLTAQDNVHQVVQRIHPDARVVYVDHDPVVAVHARALIDGDHNTAFLLEDARHTEAVLSHPETRRLIDFAQPVAALYMSVLHQLPDHDDPAGLVHAMMDLLPAGSFLAISHLVSPDPGLRARLTDLVLSILAHRRAAGRHGEGASTIA